MMDVDCYHMDGNSDAVEFCPHEHFHDILAAATYTLQEGPEPSRLGSIALFLVDAKKGLELVHRVQTVGIFDMKWNSEGCSVHPLLAQADADGCLSIYSLRSIEQAQTHGYVLREECKEKAGDAMCLYADWNSTSSSISTGLSDGSISIADINETQIQISKSWQAHNFEVWTTSFDTFQPEVLYSGSDDCRFIGWDLRQDPSTSIFQNTKSHQMGVCCISQNPMNSNVLLTGSYDEYLRVWDKRSTSVPVSKHSVCLGGGVWRIKYHPNISDLVLAACMHNGFAVVKIGDENVTVIETYMKHESLAYGVDWQRDKERKRSLVATCSFYDKLLRIWHPESVAI